MSVVPVGEPVTDPPEGSEFPQVLQGPGHSAARSLIGLMFALSGYVLGTQLVMTVVLGIGFAARGRPGSFASYTESALAFRLPEGMVAAHLGLALLIVVALVLVRYWHRRRWGFAVSVQPGMRWRFLLACVLVAVVVLNAVAWLQRPGVPFGWNPPPGVVWWLLLIVLTSPLQAAGEEFLFRGYLLQGLGSLTSRLPWLGVVASALLFALFHGTQNGWLFIDRFGFALVAGALVVLTGGLEAPIAAHVVNNVCAFSYAAVGGGVATARAVQRVGPTQALIDVGGFAAFGLVAWWVARRMRVAQVTT